MTLGTQVSFYHALLLRFPSKRDAPCLSVFHVGVWCGALFGKRLDSSQTSGSYHSEMNLLLPHRISLSHAPSSSAFLGWRLQRTEWLGTSIARVSISHMEGSSSGTWGDTTGIGNTPRETFPGLMFCRLETKVIPTLMESEHVAAVPDVSFGFWWLLQNFSHSAFKMASCTPTCILQCGLCFWKVLRSHRGNKTQPWDLGSGGALGGSQRGPVSLPSATWVSCGVLLSGPTTK